MQEKWRLLKTIKVDGSTQMATDEALMNSVRNKNQPTTLRFYQWEPQCVTLGHMQNAKEEVDFDYCKENNISIVQRISGGGCVLHNQELTYSLIIPQDKIDSNVTERFKLILDCIRLAFQKVGIMAKFKPINDLTVKEKKISGSAQTTIDGVILIHGTMLLDVDIELMQKVLKNPKFKQKENIENAITSLKSELGYDVEIEILTQLIVNEFNVLHAAEFYKGDLSDKELEEIDKLKITKYKSLV